MQIPEEAVLLRVFVGESDKVDHKPLYEAIVLKAREMHLAGATVFRTVAGDDRAPSGVASPPVSRVSVRRSVWASASGMAPVLAPPNRFVSELAGDQGTTRLVSN